LGGGGLVVLGVFGAGLPPWCCVGQRVRGRSGPRVVSGASPLGVCWVVLVSWGGGGVVGGVGVFGLVCVWFSFWVPGLGGWLGMGLRVWVVGEWWGEICVGFSPFSPLAMLPRPIPSPFASASSPLVSLSPVPPPTCLTIPPPLGVLSVLGVGCGFGLVFFCGFFVGFGLVPGCFCVLLPSAPPLSGPPRFSLLVPVCAGVGLWVFWFLGVFGGVLVWAPTPPLVFCSPPSPRAPPGGVVGGGVPLAPACAVGGWWPRPPLVWVVPGPFLRCCRVGGGPFGLVVGVLVSLRAVGWVLRDEAGRVDRARIR